MVDQVGILGPCRWYLLVRDAGLHGLGIPEKSIMSGASNKLDIPLPIRPYSLRPNSDFLHKTYSVMIDIA
jgi:hypothetical protein